MNSNQDVFRAAAPKRRAYVRAAAANGLVDGLVEMVRRRDPDTAAHLNAVGFLAYRLARHLGIEARQAQRIATGARLHDIGKQLVALGILNKPTALDADEWAAIRWHPESGAAMLAGFPSLSGYAAMVRSHHERIDGRGYPDGLAGAAIPYEARIIAIVDSYHAMTVARPYSVARDNETALRELEACSGTQFDPEFVRAFVDVMSCRSPRRGCVRKTC